MGAYGCCIPPRKVDTEAKGLSSANFDFETAKSIAQLDYGEEFIDVALHIWNFELYHQAIKL